MYERHETSAHIINIIFHFLSAIYAERLVSQPSCQWITDKTLIVENRFLQLPEAVNSKKIDAWRIAPDGRQVSYKEQNTQTVDKNIDNKVLSEAERQLRVIYWEREKTHAVNLPFRQQVTMRVTTSDIPDVEIDDVGRMTSSASQARSRWLLPTGPRSWIDPGTQNLCWMVSARFTLKMCIAA